MSGICGIAFSDQERHLKAAHLAPMVEALNVSGQGNGSVVVPDSIGIGVQKSPGRLSGVAELAFGGSRVALAFDGSLYNLNELIPSERQESDAVKDLLELYEQEGISFLRRIRGEFALALWDGREETLYIATDRFRVHPLFYYQDREKLVFASRINGILACPFAVKKTLNPEAIVDLVGSSVIPTPKTIFREVKKLPPGHLLTYCKGDIKLAPYWDINFLHSNGAGEKELARKLRVLFAEALSVRLQTDGNSDRIGTFLSGGVDSSTVTGLLTQFTKHQVKSFSIGFDEEKFNEISYARIAARAFGSDHYEYFVTPKDVCDVIPVLLETFDEPYANASAIPTYFCAKLAREHEVDILYAGDGGDELFAGNERYATERLFDYYHAIPRWFRNSVVKPLVFALADGLRQNFFVKGKKYIQRASIPYPERLCSYGLFKVIPMTELFEDSFLESVGKNYDQNETLNLYYRQAQARTELDRQLYIDLKLTISDNDLFKVTRMAEAAGVGVRFPFLDHRLAEFAATVPAGIKMRGRELRSFFKRAYADLLPPETRAKKKHGFGLPIPVWLRTDRKLNEMMRDLVLAPRAVQRGYLCKKSLDSLIECHRTDPTSFYGTIIWNLMTLELWMRESCDRAGAACQQSSSAIC